MVTKTPAKKKVDKPIKKAVVKTPKKLAVKKTVAKKPVAKKAVKKPVVKKPTKAELAAAKKLAEQQKIIATLKFTPRKYTISLWGYGGEKVMGTVSRESWDYCMDNQVDLSDVSWDYDSAEEMDLDIDKLPFTPGSWYECDNIAHANGVARNAGTLQIIDENGETVLEKSLDDFSDDEDSPEFSGGDVASVSHREPGEIVFIGSSNEKGTFFEGDINLTAPFDITKLILHYDEIDGEEIISMVTYDGEDIDNYGGSTDGKSSDFSMHLILEGGEWETYSPEEKDWGHPEFGTSPNDWERSPTFKFKKHKPVHPGWYGATWRNFGTSSGSLYWNGTEFGDWEYGQFKPEANVESWYGFNWDTTSWDNQPKEPPNIICDDKKCGWIGDSADRREDEDYNDHCPQCDGTEFSYIDFNADTKEGRANLAKYCPDLKPAKTPEQVFSYVLGSKESVSESND